MIGSWNESGCVLAIAPNAWASGDGVSDQTGGNQPSYPSGYGVNQVLMTSPHGYKADPGIIDFDNVNDRLDFAGTWLADDQPFTLEMIAEFNMVSTSLEAMTTLAGDTTNFGLLFTYHASYKGISFGASADLMGWGTGNDFNGQKRHVAIVYNGSGRTTSNFKLYVDGTERVITPFVAAFSPTAANKIGCWSNNSLHAPHKIYWWALYDIALASGTVYNNANLGDNYGMAGFQYLGGDQLLLSGLFPVADFSATPTSGITDLVVQFTDSSTNTPTGWNWDFDVSGNPGVYTSTSQNPRHTYTASGTYSVRLAAFNSLGSGVLVRTNYITVTDPAQYEENGKQVTFRVDGEPRWNSSYIGKLYFNDDSQALYVGGLTQWINVGASGVVAPPPSGHTHSHDVLTNLDADDHTAYTTHAELYNASGALDTEFTNASGALQIEIANASGALDTEFTNASGALRTDITANATAIAAVSGQMVNASGALRTDITANATAITAVSGQMVNASGTLRTDITANTTAIVGVSGIYSDLLSGTLADHKHLHSYLSASDAFPVSGLYLDASGNVHIPTSGGIPNDTNKWLYIDVPASKSSQVGYRMTVGDAVHGALYWEDDNTEKGLHIYSNLGGAGYQAIYEKFSKKYSDTEVSTDFEQHIVRSTQATGTDNLVGTRTQQKDSNGTQQTATEYGVAWSDNTAGSYDAYFKWRTANNGAMVDALLLSGVTNWTFLSSPQTALALGVPTGPQAYLIDGEFRPFANGLTNLGGTAYWGAAYAYDVYASGIKAGDNGGLYFHDNAGNGLTMADGGKITSSNYIGVGGAPDEEIHAHNSTGNAAIKVSSDTDNADLIMDAPANEFTALRFRRAGLYHWQMRRPANEDCLEILSSGTNPVIQFGEDGDIHMPNIKSGTDQADAGAAAGELYFDTNDDNTVKMGV